MTQVAVPLRRGVAPAVTGLRWEWALRILPLATEPLALAGAVVLLGVEARIIGLVALIYVLTRPTQAERALLRPRLTHDLVRLSARLAPVMVGSALLVATEHHEVLLAAPVAFGMLATARGGVRFLTRAAHRRGLSLEPTVVVGAGAAGVAISRILQAHPELGLLPVGFVDAVEPEGGDLPLLGAQRDLPDLLLRRGIRRVVVAFGVVGEADLVSVLRACDALPFRIHAYTVPRFFELGAMSETDADDLWGFPLVPLRRPACSRKSWHAKRAFDMAVASLSLLAMAPLFAAIALAVKLSSPGPVLFRQTRIGQFGRQFEILKFRSMRENDDGDTQWSVSAGTDHRVTTVGRILRPSHLDELPQLINVLRGEMSLVGPRPERPLFVDRFTTRIVRYEDRHRVPGGITGWAQVHGFWGDTSIADRARLDNRYIEDWSLSRDLKIIVRTIPSMFGRSKETEAYEATKV